MCAWEKFNPSSKESPFKKVSDAEIKAAATSATPEGQKRREVAKGEKPLEGASDLDINVAVEGLEKGTRQVRLEQAKVADEKDIQAAAENLDKIFDDLEKKNEKRTPQQEARP